MQILVAGSRTIHDYQRFTSTMSRLLTNVDFDEVGITIIEGGANGVDTLAWAYALDHGLLLNTMKADWDGLGRAAGMIRNGEMVKLATHAVIFWDGVSSGTQDTINRVRKKGIPHRIFTVKPSPVGAFQYDQTYRSNRIHRH